MSNSEIGTYWRLSHRSTKSEDALNLFFTTPAFRKLFITYLFFVKYFLREGSSYALYSLLLTILSTTNLGYSMVLSFLSQ